MVHGGRGRRYAWHAGLLRKGGQHGIGERENRHRQSHLGCNVQAVDRCIGQRARKRQAIHGDSAGRGRRAGRGSDLQGRKDHRCSGRQWRHRRPRRTVRESRTRRVLATGIGDTLMITTKAKVRLLLSALPVLLTLYAPVSASAQETYAGSNQDVRMVLYFNVPPAALLKFLPQGWELSPATTGPTAGANLVVEFVDQLWAMDPKGVVAAPYRYVLFGMPVKHNGSNATDLMLFDGLS